MSVPASDEAAIARDACVTALHVTGYASTRAARAMRRVPRELFLPESERARAYEDTPRIIGEGQTMSAPHMVAIMLSALDPPEGARVLEIGGGSGYHAACLAELVGPEGAVDSIEYKQTLAEHARENLDNAGYASRVRVHVGDGSLGLPERAPFDAVHLACAAPAIPTPLFEQVSDGGRILAPIGSRYGQELTLATREGARFKMRDLGGCVFVPLLGRHGFDVP